MGGESEVDDLNSRCEVEKQTPTQPQIPNQGENLATSDEGSPTSSMTWENKSDGLSEVDISDLYN